MPQLKLRGIKAEKISPVSKEMIDGLQALLECPRNYFSIECQNATYVIDGEISEEGYPIVEIWWFDRGQEVQDKAAKIVTDYVHKAGYADVDIIFIQLAEKDYYENGEHF